METLSDLAASEWKNNMHFVGMNTEFDELWKFLKKTANNF